MIIRLRTDVTGPLGHHLAGAVLDLPEPLAAHYLHFGHADVVSDVISRATDREVVQTATSPLSYRPLGGAWYELSDGRKVRGRTALSEATGVDHP